MAKQKELTKEQRSEIEMLLKNNEMLEKTKKEAIDRGREKSAEQIQAAQDEVIAHIQAIDPTAVGRAGSGPKNSVFDNSDMGFLDMLEDSSKYLDTVEEETPTATEVYEEKEEEPTPSKIVVSDDRMYNNTDGDVAYDIIELPSNGEPYKSKISRVPVAYLTAYDENMITSPNLYKDGLVIDMLLKNKIVNSDIDVDELVSGDADAIILFLRATSYGAEFPIMVSDPETGEQIDSVVDLTTLKPREFKLKADENGYFDYTTPIRKDKIKFRYLTRKQEKNLQRVTELEGYGTKAFMLDRERETLLGAILNDRELNDGEKKTIRNAVKVMESWAKKLRAKNDSKFNRIITNNMMLQVVSVNGNSDRDFVRKAIETMPARDSLMLRRYINDNRPGIDFEIEVQRPESLGGGSFKTFLNWDDSVFLNIPDV